MRKGSIYLYLVFAILFVFVLACKPPRENQIVQPQRQVMDNPFLQSFIKGIDHCLMDSLAKYPVPGLAICIVKDSAVVYTRCFGEKEFGSGDSLDIHSAFRLASVSKPIAALLAATYVKDSLLDWEDKVVQHLPWFKLCSPYQTNDLRVAHVLSHTSGVPYHALTNFIEYGECLDTMIWMLREPEIDSISPVGQIYSYQNVTYSVIEKVMQSISGITYEEMISERLFGPLGMEDASVTYQGLFADSNVAYPHFFYNGTWNRVPVKKTYYNAKPAGGVNASISDMSKILLLALGNQPDVVPGHVLKEMYQPRVETPIKYKYFSRWDSLQDMYYGLGFRILHTSYDTIIYHGGYANAYRSELAFSPKNKIGICILSNSPAYMTNICVPAFFDFYEQYADSVRMFELDSVKTPLLKN